MNAMTLAAAAALTVAAAAPRPSPAEGAAAYFPTLEQAAAAEARVALAGTGDTGRTALQATIYWENDGGWVKPVDRHDEHYTHGAGLSIAARPAWARDLIGSLWSPDNEFCPTAHPNETAYAVGLLLAQDIYTPEDYSKSQPQPDDRPYAGYLRAGFYFQRERDFGRTGEWWRPEATLEHFQFDFGVIGPSSLAKNAQIWVHRGYGYAIPQGWANQLHDEPAFDFTYVRKWRKDLLLVPEVGVLQAIPEAGLTVGTVRREATFGTTLRFSLLGEPKDFGAARLRLPGSFTRDHEYGGIGLFVRPAVHFVEHNTLIEGNNWRSSPVTQNIEPVFGEFQFGLTVQLIKNLEIGYSWTYRTPEFGGQRGWDSIGAFTLSAGWEF